MTKRIDKVSIFDDIQKMLEQISPQYTLYILSTNSYENIEHVLIKNNVVKYFARIYSNVGLFGKSRGIRKLMRQQNLKPNECIYIGDEIRDIEASHKAGLKCISVGWGYSDVSALKHHNADMLANKPSDILKIVESI